MKRDYCISVAIATYNGEKYIKEQLISILNQSIPVDEIIVSDDDSTDDTIKIVNSLKDNRVKIIEGPKKGIKKNFENAIKNTTGDYIFLSDQDDIWINNKVEKVLNAFENNDCTLVIHNADIVDNELNSINKSVFEWRKSRKGIIKNIIKNTYVGCCMAFEKDLIKYIIPIPNDIEMHDQWIGIINEKKYGKSLFISDKLIKYRRHNDNSSSMKHYSLIKMIKNRVLLTWRIVYGRDN